MTTTAFRPLLTAAALLALVVPAAAQSAAAPISTAVNAEEGEYLVDGGGLALYTFKADTRGRGSAAPVSACDGDCLGEWPPLLVEGAPVGDGKVNAALLGTLTRADGTVQATYNGWPLYYYFEDFAAGDINGDDIESFGEDWYLIGPHGARPGKDAGDD